MFLFSYFFSFFVPSSSGRGERDKSVRGNVGGGVGNSKSLWSKRTPKSGAGGKNNMVPLGVLERLYSFLYLATMPSSDPSAMHKRNVLHIQSLENLTDSTATAGGKAKASEDGGGAVQLPAPLSVEDRTVAVQVLVALACSRGCVRGLLLSIAVLLGVGLSPPPSKPNLEDARISSVEVCRRLEAYTH